MKTLVAVFVSLFVAISAFAEPLAKAQSGGTQVMLYTDPCTLPAVVNLPNRAEWIDGSKMFEGCWSTDIIPGFVILYFSDRFIVAIPVRALTEVTAI